MPVPGSPGLLERQPLGGNEGQPGAEAQAQAGCPQPRGHPSSCLSWDRRLSLSTWRLLASLTETAPRPSTPSSKPRWQRLPC